MSGTSLDGIDLAVCEFVPPESSKTGSWEYQIGIAETRSYEPKWKQKLQEAITYDGEDLNVLNEEYTSVLATYINAFIAENKIENLDAVCSHGHTILHQPQNGITLQIGNLPKISVLTQQTVVCGFRAQDVAMGGQGAPLVPIGDQLLFGEYDYCLNLGGFANISTHYSGNRIAYDICPMNIVLNQLTETIGVPYDDNGSIARSGAVSHTLLKQLNNLAYYKQTAPKSLGLEWVKEFINPLIAMSGLSVEDKIATFTSHAATQIAAQTFAKSTMLITGGGAYNSYLLELIEGFGELTSIVPAASLLEFKEALIFGFLGVRRLRGEINCLASVTGAFEDHCSGVLFEF
jgi:anhydro-N-acetylmuramic acid kinase